MTDVAKEYGYSDGSGVHRVVNQLEARAKVARQLDRHLKSLASHMSSVKSRPRCLGRGIVGQKIGDQGH